jgi:hypothetical protein
MPALVHWPAQRQYPLEQLPDALARTSVSGLPERPVGSELGLRLVGPRSAETHEMSDEERTVARLLSGMRL